MISPIEFVLVAIMAVRNPNNETYEIQYQPLDYFHSMQSCITQKNRLQKKRISGKDYICLKVDRN
jgi:hypothetical protein